MEEESKKSPTSKPYVAGQKGLHDTILPKGVLGYEGKKPVFSQRTMINLWMLRVLSNGEVWWGKEIAHEIMRRSELKGIYSGYNLNAGALFDTLGKWRNDGLIVEVSEADALREGVTKPIGPDPKFVRITDAGLAYFEDLKADHHGDIVAATGIFNKLYADLYGAFLVCPLSSTYAAIGGRRHTG
jgi:DNA-binding PadR family transcriptional regulator